MLSEKRSSHPDAQMGSFIVDGGQVKGRMESEGSFLCRGRVWQQQCWGSSCGTERAMASGTTCCPPGVSWSKEKEK